MTTKRFSQPITIEVPHWFFEKQDHLIDDEFVNAFELGERNDQIDGFVVSTIMKETDRAIWVTAHTALSTEFI